jgi:outer membrane protein TolC
VLTFIAPLTIAAITTAQPAEPLRLSLADAVTRGLDANLAAIEARETVRTAEGARQEARAPLLPNLQGGLSASRQVINLEAYGFPPPAGQSALVGPFNVLDARLYVSQSVLDLQAIGLSRAAGLSAEAARSGAAAIREDVVVTCAGLYLRAAADERRIDAIREEVEAAQSLYEHAVRLKETGVVAGIEVLRAQVELAAQRQRLIVAQNDEAKDKLALARAIGLSFDQPFELSDGLVYKPEGEVALDAALRDAYGARPDVTQAANELAAAEATRDAHRRERAPTLRFTADFGTIGSDTSSLETTYMAGMALRFPLFEGGRIQARVLQDEAEVARRQASLTDLRAGVALEVRSGLLDLTSAGDRVSVAEGALDLARQQLGQAQDRFQAGVAGNLEVVQAQDAFGRASDDYLTALQAHNVARLALARARGTAEREIPTFLSAPAGEPHE